jgi:hypothetical protein
LSSPVFVGATEHHSPATRGQTIVRLGPCHP